MGIAYLDIQFAVSLFIVVSNTFSATVREQW